MEKKSVSKCKEGIRMMKNRDKLNKKEGEILEQ